MKIINVYNNIWAVEIVRIIRKNRKHYLAWKPKYFFPVREYAREHARNLKFYQGFQTRVKKYIAE